MLFATPRFLPLFVMVLPLLMHTMICRVAIFLAAPLLFAEPPAFFHADADSAEQAFRACVCMLSAISDELIFAIFLYIAI